MSALCLTGIIAAPLSAQTAEISSKDAPVIFKSTSNLIPVPVVVRDSKGHRRRESHHQRFPVLFDDGKPRAISKFTVEKTETGPASVATPTLPPTDIPVAGNGTPPPATAPEAAPDRFVAYLFDDLHMSASRIWSLRVTRPFARIGSSRLTAGERAGSLHHIRQRHAGVHWRPRQAAVRLDWNWRGPRGGREVHGESRIPVPVGQLLYGDLIYNSVITVATIKTRRESTR